MGQHRGFSRPQELASLSALGDYRELSGSQMLVVENPEAIADAALDEPLDQPQTRKPSRMSAPGRILVSASTWKQTPAPPATPTRRDVISNVVERVIAFGSRRLRVGVDGLTAAGKTTFADELAVAVAAEGRTVLRATLDDFKRPWSESHLLDRTSGEGYYRNAFDTAAIRRLLLEPASITGNGLVALCSIDPITQINYEHLRATVPSDGVLVVDGVFAFRPELNDLWDLRLWLDVDSGLSLQRGTTRDASLAGSTDAAEDLHRNRYQVAERLYIHDVDPKASADIVIDNSNLARPVLVYPSTAHAAHPPDSEGAVTE